MAYEAPPTGGFKMLKTTSVTAQVKYYTWHHNNYVHMTHHISQTHPYNKRAKNKCIMPISMHLICNTNGSRYHVTESDTIGGTTVKTTTPS